MLSRMICRRRSGTVLLVALVATALNAAVVLSGAKPAAAADQPKLLGVTPTGTTAVPGTKATTWPRTTKSGRLAVTSRVTDPKLAAEAMRDTGAAASELTCSESIDAFTGGVGEDGFLEETVQVFYDAIVQCDYFLNRITGVAGAFDRTPSFNGQVFDGAVIGGGSPIDNVEDFFGESVGGFQVDAISYNRVTGLPFKAEELAGVIEDVIHSA